MTVPAEPAQVPTPSLRRFLREHLPRFLLTPLRQAARGISYGVGWLLFHLPTRQRYLKGVLCNPRRTFLERTVEDYFFNHRFYQDVSRYRREVIGQGQAGSAWTEVYRSRRASAAEQFHEVLALLGQVIQQLQAQNVMQVGCAGGGELAVLAQRFPRVAFAGIDLNGHIIRQNALDFCGTPNLCWLTGDVFATDHLERERPDLVFTSGTAEYFTEAELEIFLQVVHRSGVKAVCFSEPVTQINFDYHGSEHSTRRGMMAFNHPYGRKLRAAGAREVQEVLRPDPEHSSVLSVLSLGYF